LKDILKILLIFLSLFTLKKSLSQVNNTLIFPKNDYWITKDTTLFIWNRDTNSINFEVFVSSNITFSDTIYTSGLIATNYDSIYALSNGSYFWMVKTHYNNGNFSYSNIYQFNVFKPISIPNIGLWLKPEAGITLNNGKVVEWKDQSGNLNDAIQTDTNLSPNTSSITLNGYNPIQFDGVNDYLLLKDSLENPFNLFFLIDIDTIVASASLFSDVSHTNGLIYYFATEKIALWRGSQIIYSPIKSGSNFYNISHQNTSLNMYKNGVSMTLSTNGPINNIKIRRIGTSTFKPFAGRMYEIIGFNGSITQNEQDSVNNYLHYKYSPPINLGANIYTSNYCDTILKAKKGFTSYLWQDGSTADSLIVNKTGYYSCTVTDIFGFTSTDSVYVQYPSFNYPTDSVFCLNDSLTWNANLNKNNFSFLWSNGTTDSLLNITQAGNYWLKVTDSSGCFQYSDTLTIAVDSFPQSATLGPDKTICQGAFLSLMTGNNPTTFIWNTGDTTAQIKIDTAGAYWLQATNNNNCVAKDTIQIALNGIAPTVGFNASPLCTNQAVLFVDTSSTTDGSNIISWHWNFGDGDTSNAQNPQHLYATSNAFTVSLTITTAGFFTSTNQICAGLPVAFTDNSFSSDGTLINWQWNFGDAGIADTSILQNPNYIYATSNVFNVQLIVSTNFNCKDTVNNFVVVKPSPIAAFLYNDSCVNNSVSFINTSQGNIANTNWSFGDVSTSNLTNPTHLYSSSGLYNVDLIVTGINGCYDSIRQLVTIYDNPIAYFVPNNFCVLTSQQFYDSSSTSSGIITNWNWNVEGNQNPIFSFGITDTGSFFVDLSVTSSVGCKDSAQDTISVYPLPKPQFTLTPNIGAPPLTVNFTNQTVGINSYFWNFGDNDTSSVFSPTHIYNDSNIFTINLIATSLFGCVDSTTQTIKVIKPVLDVGVVGLTYKFLSNTNFLSISATLVNFGAFNVNSLNIIASTSSSNSIMENWVGNLNIGNTMVYQFTGSFEIKNGEIPDLICVRAEKPNGFNDDIPGNNEFCVALNKFTLIALYPNPTSNLLNVDYIVPDKGEIKIQLTDVVGKKIINLYNGVVAKGLNRQQFNLGIYASGTYVISIEYGTEIIRKKIILVIN